MAQKRTRVTTRRATRCARPGCSNEIEPSGRARHQIYCSPACRVGAFQGRPKVQLQRRPCRQCGRLFMPDRSTARFCSPECRWAFNGSAAGPRPRRRAAARKVAPKKKRAASRKAAPRRKAAGAKPARRRASARR